MRRPEQVIHKAVVQHLRQRATPGVVWWHTGNNVPMRGKHAARIGGIMKSLGVRAGISDILAFHNSTLYCLELKAPGGRPTESQISFISDIEAQGGFGVVAEGLDEAVRCLEAWKLLKGKSS